MSATYVNRLSGALNQFRVAIPSTSCMYIRCLCFDLIEIDSATVHAVVRDTKFSTARILHNEAMSTVEDTSRVMWGITYPKLPDEIAFDQGPQFFCVKWETLLFKYKTATKQSEVWSHHALVVGIRCHSYLRRIYDQFRADPSTARKNSRCQSA